jgi:3-hydroxyacyl-CoA dehydrogenase
MKVAIIGAGVMGRGWITQFAMAGHTVHCFDESAEATAKAPRLCAELAGKAAKRAKIDDPELAKKTEANIHAHASKAEFVAAAKGCDVFFEVIFEDMDLKQRVLGEIVPQLPPGVYFWSNTSSLDIDVLGEASGRPDRSIVVHGMNPVPMMAGVEVVPGHKTTPDTVEFVRKTLLDMKKAPFVAPNIPGFWVNRLLIPQQLDAMRLLERGLVRVEDGDVGMNTSLGHPQGVFKLADFITLPTILRIACEMFGATGDPRLYPPQILVRMVAAGENGANAAKGFYDWSNPKEPKARDLSQYTMREAKDFLAAVK